MQLSKRDFMERAWIRIIDRMPPDTREEVLTFSQHGHIMSFPGFLARRHAEVMLGKDYYKHEPSSMTPERRITHWMPLFPPAGKKTFEEQREQAMQTKKSRRRRS